VPTIVTPCVQRLDTQRFVCTHTTDLHLTTLSEATGHSVDSYDELSVTEAYTTADGGSYKLLLVKGAPYVTVEYTACALKLAPLALFESINGEVRGCVLLLSVCCYCYRH
jgi:hypothetical protein